MNPTKETVKKSASHDSFLTAIHKTEQLEEVLGEVLKEPEGAPAEAVTPKEEEAQDPYQKVDPEQQLNKFWIAISGYQLDRAFLVYRFFNDIGKIQSKGFTQTNVMYLKYLSTVDCQIALSYDGQKIGYGGDIRVSVKPENPMALQAFLGAIEEMDDADVVDSGPLMMSDAVTPTDLKASCVIEMEAPKQQQQEPKQGLKQKEEQQQATEQLEQQQLEQPSEPEEVKVEPPVNVDVGDVASPKKSGFIQWLKEKISAIFFFY
ncbi:uncharacterized protein LOC111064671 [Drosophila obscura]|uniref:uncharacterized protein LOC111064671 n=1 Tax=Drosophila obscura TaxID=7282 RepID=UPI001BB26F1C|nr:uncharacterized protein LOC111064671 [Drosophila obscura]